MGPPTADSKEDATISGFSPVSSTRIFWNSRKRTANGRSMETMEEDLTTPIKSVEIAVEENQQDSTPALSERRKALFEPLTPVINPNGRRPAAETLLPPPDFDSTAYPRGWLIGKKRKLVNVDVVESMRRIAVQEMNRKDREIDGLNEQLEEDARCLQHLQLQLLKESSKRAEIERENTVLQNQVSMLMNMLQENEEVDEPTNDS